MSNPTYGGINYNSGAANGSKYSVISGNGEPSRELRHLVRHRSLCQLAQQRPGQPAIPRAGPIRLLGGTATPSNGQEHHAECRRDRVSPQRKRVVQGGVLQPEHELRIPYLYGTGSNTAPTATGPTATPNSANYNNAWANLTAVGAYTGTTSPYGAFDMAGNVFQWNEALISGSYRGLRGGSFDGYSDDLQSSYRNFSSLPSSEGDYFGFRVASVPEPGTGVLAVLAFGLMWVLRKRFK